MRCDWNIEGNVKRAKALVTEAAKQGAQIVLLQELFATPYFCKDQDDKHFALAEPLNGNTLVQQFSQLARELSVVLPVSFFERANNSFFNSIAVIDATGECLGLYRKSHIPDSPGYDEKFYFSPGDTNFKVWDTKYGRLGVAICWDQWFPEAARSMVLQGAEALLYPTAIGSEPSNASLDSKDHWQRVMQGHAAANLVPVVASNRIGEEHGKTCNVTFYGSSFIADHTGAIVKEANRTDQAVLVAEFDLDAIREARVSWGVFRDRRPDLYEPLLTLDGRPPAQTWLHLAAHTVTGSSRKSFRTPLEAGYRMPAEWEAHERCWMAWPCRKALWGDGFSDTQRAYAAVASAIAEFEPVTMLTPPNSFEQARALCSTRVEIFPADLDDSWTRDTGPNFLTREDSALAAAVFQFNAWGRKYETFRQDAALGHRLAEYLRIPTFTSPLFLEGGAINVDGEGTVLTTEQCVLNENRNPGITKREAERELCHALGAKKVIWLPGDPLDEETDGHVDGVACFVKPGVVMVELCPADGERAMILEENLVALRGERDAKGRALEIIVIHEAYEAEPRSDIFANSYINFYLANGGVVMPGFGIERDEEAQQTVARAFPDRRVVQVPINDIAIGGGGIHCITQQQPKVS